MNVCVFYFAQAVRIRVLGGADFKDMIYRGWKECVTDAVLAQGTWKGQVKCTKPKDRDLKFEHPV